MSARRGLQNFPSVIPAYAGIQTAFAIALKMNLDARLCGHDGLLSCLTAALVSNNVR
jgi:hypothetical protein